MHVIDEVVVIKGNKKYLGWTCYETHENSLLLNNTKSMERDKETSLGYHILK